MNKDFDNVRILVNLYTIMRTNQVTHWPQHAWCVWHDVELVAAEVRKPAFKELLFYGHKV